MSNLLIEDQEQVQTSKPIKIIASSTISHGEDRPTIQKSPYKISDLNDTPDLLDDSTDSFEKHVNLHDFGDVTPNKKRAVFMHKTSSLLSKFENKKCFCSSQVHSLLHEKNPEERQYVSTKYFLDDDNPSLYIENCSVPEVDNNVFWPSLVSAKIPGIQVRYYLVSGYGSRDQVEPWNLSVGVPLYLRRRSLTKTPRQVYFEAKEIDPWREKGQHEDNHSQRGVLRSSSQGPVFWGWVS